LQAIATPTGVDVCRHHPDGQLHLQGWAELRVIGHADVNCNGTDTSADIILMVNFVFKSGVSPCSKSAGG